jgi:FkbM family methyltransferase
MYGMGNGADKILKVCKKYGIKVADFFASDGFVRGQSFHGKTVLSFSDVVDIYGKDNIIVLVSFASSLPDVMENIYKISRQCETYIPDVPVRGDTLFCEEFETANSAAISEAYELLCDDRSREVYRGVLDFRRTGRIEHLLATADNRDEVMKTLLDLDNYKVAADLGAYNGDTAEELIDLCPHIERIYAFEPDRRNFKKLSVCASAHPQIIPINSAAWSEDTTLIFDDSGNRNSGLIEDGLSKRRAEVSAVALDNVVKERVDFIKYDVEGAEKEALIGSSESIRKYHPDLLVSIYHRTEDLHELIRLIHVICPEYKLYLRRYPYIPAWDLNLYATVK